MAEYSANAIQTVNPGETVVFTEVDSPCQRGFVRFREGSGSFLLNGWLPNRNCQCACSRNREAEYLVTFGANIAIPEGGTVGEISVAFSIDGATVPATQMSVTPAAVNQYFNVSRSKSVGVWRGCCETVSIRNTSDQPILLKNVSVIFSRPDLAVTY